MSVNKHLLIGHLGRDPKITGDGKVATFSLATSRRWTDKATGEARETTAWHNVVIFAEPLIDVARKFLKKGSCVFVEGEVLSRKYKAADGSERTVTETVMNPFRGGLTLLDRAEKPAPGPDSYGQPGPDEEVPL
jgi:single-strand DNA-binding protein